ncbi:hypothetical protein BTA51_26020 [Hahella sp. CCB-MM4]|uniref:hypothetical protein n=1 Tax=Hahella sp. (strain CCB-MM4) TaxID=1926491 RepID=UPI000B9BC7B3|nr:hypothetical protein [Hahella sp. CCB-MM4]OZG70416.1 hypothetical protein BTA51_25960 [Hahella sp. CCB-MM4]OZG70428.1 hypothetical protein BTA51_26020 [Hahella sp. CCB-MM4]
MNQYALVCTELDTGGACISQQWQQVYLIPAESGTAAELFLTGGFSAEAMGIGFGGAMTLFVAGLGIGFALKALRRI